MAEAIHCSSRLSLDDAISYITNIILAPSPCWNALYLHKLTKTLQVKCEETSLLRHPVVKSFVYLKWKKLGLKFYVGILLPYILLVGFLSLFAVTVNHPLSENCKQCTMYIILLDRPVETKTSMGSQ